MTRLVLILLPMAVVLSGCFDQTVRITSSPTDAGVYSNRDRLGNTPLLTSKDEIMPLWNYYGTFSRAVITIKKAGYEDYLVDVNELTMPSAIHARLVPIAVQEQVSDSRLLDKREGIENRLTVLKQSLDRAAISKDEYDARRKEILGGL